MVTRGQITGVHVVVSIFIVVAVQRRLIDGEYISGLVSMTKIVKHALPPVQNLSELYITLVHHFVVVFYEVQERRLDSLLFDCVRVAVEFGTFRHHKQREHISGYHAHGSVKQALVRLLSHDRAHDLRIERSMLQKVPVEFTF